MTRTATTFPEEVNKADPILQTLVKLTRFYISAHENLLNKRPSLEVKVYSDSSQEQPLQMTISIFSHLIEDFPQIYNRGRLGLGQLKEL